MAEDNRTETSREFEYEVVGGPAAQITTALQFAAIVNYRKATVQAESTLNAEVELTQAEVNAYEAALGLLEKVWKADLFETKQLVVKSVVSHATPLLNDDISVAIGNAVQRYQGRVGFFTLDLFITELSAVTGSKDRTPVDIARSILVSRPDVDVVDTDLFSSNRS